MITSKPPLTNKQRILYVKVVTIVSLFPIMYTFLCLWLRRLNFTPSVCLTIVQNPYEIGSKLTIQGKIHTYYHYKLVYVD